MTERETSLMKAIFNVAADAQMGGFYHVSDVLFQAMDQLDMDLNMLRTENTQPSFHVIQGGKA